MNQTPVNLPYPTLPPLADRCSTVWQQLVAQTRDTIQGAGFTKVVLGLSGGIDSALVASIAVEAVGPDNVLGVLMPSPYSTEGSVVDALELAANLGIATKKIPIEPAYVVFNDMLAESFAGAERDVTEENIQARIRGVILMALSNKFGHYVLATGNKSEALAGYATLYGDMVGAFAPLAPLYKMHVFELAQWLNHRNCGVVIPEQIIKKEPSAELSHGQLDSHSLPYYWELDAILYELVDKQSPASNLLQHGFDPAAVEQVQRLLKASEFKRQFAPPGPAL